jgi:type IV pilus assembly protein PilB
VSKFDKKLAGILAKYGVLAEEQRENILAAAEEGKKSLTAYLIEQKLSTEAGIIGAVAMDMNLPPIDIEKVELDPEALSLVPEDIARHYQVLPVAKIGNTLTLAVANPLDVLTQDDVNIVTGCDLMPVVSTDVSINKGIQKAYKTEDPAVGDMEDMVGEMGLDDDEIEVAGDIEESIDVGAALAESGSAPVVKLVNMTIYEGVKAGASGIHIEPYEKKIRIRYRIDGVCMEKMSPPKRLHGALASRIKIISNLDIAERRRPQDGKFRMKFKDRFVDFRVSILPVLQGEKIVMRILDSTAAGKDLHSLGFEERALADIQTAIKSANGMVLIVGPTGCGKTTTLYAAMKEIISVKDNITTVEDPVEYTMAGVNQVQVNERRGMTFPAALRSILRQDPDKVLIGEIRDLETAEIATKAALTGHLVFSTIHANDAPSTVTRLVNMGVDSFLVASCVILVAAQRLVRRLCEECKESYSPTPEQMQSWGFTEKQIAEEPVLFMAAGCSRCGGVGYAGRLPLLETLPIDHGLREMIARGASVVEIKKKALEAGMLTLRRSGISQGLRGDIDMQGVLSSTAPDR